MNPSNTNQKQIINSRFGSTFGRAKIDSRGVQLILTCLVH